VTQAVIPAASFSAASFPASHTTPPALFPILDFDGILKPALLVLVEQARIAISLIYCHFCLYLSIRPPPSQPRTRLRQRCFPSSTQMGSSNRHSWCSSNRRESLSLMSIYIYLYLYPPSRPHPSPPRTRHRPRYFRSLIQTGFSSQRSLYLLNRRAPSLSISISISVSIYLDLSIYLYSAVSDPRLTWDSQAGTPRTD